MKYKPLTPNEIPIEAKKAFNFSSQKLMSHKNGSANYIERTCLQCGSKKWIKVAEVRTMKHPGFCFECVHVLRDQTGPNNQNWKGGRHQVHGYIWVKATDHPYASPLGYVSEHRLVVETRLGRYLIPGETVHHKNGIRHDNRDENLELWVSGHAGGQRYEDLSTTQILELIDTLQYYLKRKVGCEK